MCWKVTFLRPFYFLCSFSLLIVIPPKSKKYADWLSPWTGHKWKEHSMLGHVRFILPLGVSQRACLHGRWARLRTPLPWDMAGCGARVATGRKACVSGRQLLVPLVWQPGTQALSPHIAMCIKRQNKHTAGARLGHGRYSNGIFIFTCGHPRTNGRGNFSQGHFVVGADSSMRTCTKN